MSIKESLNSYFNESDASRICSALKTGLPVIITGFQGPTGKSTLKDKLRSIGVDAIEMTGLEKDMLVILESKNNEIIRRYDIKKPSNAAYILIVLNELLGVAVDDTK